MGVPCPQSKPADYFEQLLYSVSDTVWGQSFPTYRLWRSAKSQIEWAEKTIAQLENYPESLLVDATSTTVLLAKRHLTVEIARLSEVLALLDNISITENVCFDGLVSSLNAQLSPGIRNRFRKLFDCHLFTKSWVYEVLSDMQSAQAKQHFQFRACVECLEANRDDWYVVFDTLTYNPDFCESNQMFKLEVTKWLHNIRNKVGIALYGSVRNAKQDAAYTYFRYCLVYEKHKDGRLHAHVLYFMKRLPEGTLYSDPNEKNRSRPNRLQPVKFPRPDFGFSNPIAVRFDGGDVWARRHGWSWPLDKTGVPRKPSSPIALARYLTKYISKEKSPCRTRMSQNFGIRSLVTQLENLTIPELCQLTRHVKPLNYHTLRVPRSLMTRLARRVMTFRLRDSLLGSLDRSRTLNEIWPTKLRSALSSMTPAQLSSREQTLPLRPDRLYQGLTHLTTILKHSSFEHLFLTSTLDSATFNKKVQSFLDENRISSYVSYSGPLNTELR